MMTPLVIGKVVMAFTSAQTEHGGQESAIPAPPTSGTTRV
jgi:hypothetical protein